MRDGGPSIFKRSLPSYSNLTGSSLFCDNLGCVWLAGRVSGDCNQSCRCWTISNLIFSLHTQLIGVSFCQAGDQLRSHSIACFGDSNGRTGRVCSNTQKHLVLDNIRSIVARFLPTYRDLTRRLRCNYWNIWRFWSGGCQERPYCGLSSFVNLIDGRYFETISARGHQINRCVGEISQIGMCCEQRESTFQAVIHVNFETLNCIASVINRQIPPDLYRSQSRGDSFWRIRSSRSLGSPN